MTVAKKLAITLKRSPIGRPEPQVVTLRTLGLKETGTDHYSKG